MFHPWLLVLLIDQIVVLQAFKLAGSLDVLTVNLLLFVEAHISLIVFRSPRRWSRGKMVVCLFPRVVVVVWIYR